MYAVTLEQLKEKVRSLIGNAKPEAALIMLDEWATSQGDELLKNNVALIKADLKNMEREVLLGLLDSSSAGMRRAKLNFQILELLGTLSDRSGTNSGGRQSAKVPIAALQPIRKAILTADYPEALRLFDEYFDQFPNPKYSTLKQTIEHYLSQGLMPPPATRQALEMLFNQLERDNRM